jgi:hypothetical protein
MRDRIMAAASMVSPCVIPAVITLDLSGKFPIPARRDGPDNRCERRLEPLFTSRIAPLAALCWETARQRQIVRSCSAVNDAIRRSGDSRTPGATATARTFLAFSQASNFLDQYRERSICSRLPVEAGACRRRSRQAAWFSH